MNSILNDFTSYKFVKVIGLNEDDYYCMEDNHGGRLAISYDYKTVRYYPSVRDNIITKEGKSYPFIYLKIMYDLLSVGDNEYDYVTRAYVNYDADNPLLSKNLVNVHGVDLTRFVAALHPIKVYGNTETKSIDVSEILVTVPSKPLNKEGDLRFPVVSMFNHVKGGNLLHPDNLRIITSGKVFSKYSTALAEFESKIPENERYTATKLKFAVVGGTYYNEKDIEGDKLLDKTSFKIEPLEFEGDPSLDYFNNNRRNLTTLYRAAGGEGLPRNIKFGQLFYVLNKTEKFNKLTGEFENGDEWSDQVKVINDDNYFVGEHTIKNKEKDLEIEEMNVKPVEEIRIDYITELDTIIENLEDNDDSYPSEFLKRAVELEKVIRDKNSNIEDITLKFNTLKKEVKEFVVSGDIQDFRNDIKTLKDLLEKVKSTGDKKVKEEFDAHVAYMLDEYGEDEDVEELSLEVEKITLNDYDDSSWKEYSRDDFIKESSKLINKNISIDKPADLKSKKDNELFLEKVEGGNLFAQTEDDYYNDIEAAPITIPDTVWAWVRIPRNYGSVSQGNEGLTYQASGKATVTKDPFITGSYNKDAGDIIYKNYKKIDSELEKRNYYNALDKDDKKYVRMKIKADNDAKLNEILNKYTTIEDTLEAVIYLSKFSLPTISKILEKIEGDTTLLESAIRQVRGKKNPQLNNRVVTEIKRLKGEDISVAKEIKYDESEENVAAFEKLNAIEDTKNVFLVKGDFDKEFRFRLPDGTTLDINRIPGLINWINRNKIKPYVEIRNTVADVRKYVDDNEDTITDVTVIELDVNNDLAYQITVFTKSGSKKFVLSKDSSVTSLESEIRKIVDNNIKKDKTTTKADISTVNRPKSLSGWLEYYVADMGRNKSTYKVTEDSIVVTLVGPDDTVIKKLRAVNTDRVLELLDEYEIKEGD